MVCSSRTVSRGPFPAGYHHFGFGTPLVQLIDRFMAAVLLSKQQAAVLNSVVNMGTRRNIRLDISSEASDSRFLENCRLLGLAQRETEVSRLLVRGKTSKEIASNLFISDKTVTKHIQNIFVKASVSNKVNFINKVLGLASCPGLIGVDATSSINCLGDSSIHTTG